MKWRSYTRGSLLWKGAVDRVGAVVLTVLTLPMMTVLALAIAADSGWPVLIRQRRIGRHGAEFKMWKFRTLPRETPEVAKSALDHRSLRITRLGRFLRQHSLDELPQLMNVLAGDMSLIGPRPALYTQTDLTALRSTCGVLEAKPGLTGLAQVSGRENLPLADKVALDAQYVRNITFLTDLRIAIRTVEAVLRPRGNY